MHEEFLYYIWENKLFQPELQTTMKEPIVVESSGYRNLDSGPDYSNARIRIGNTLWAGNIEIHVRASDWYLHGHHNDPSYQNIILHVVYYDDKVIYNDEGSQIPCLELKGKFNELLFTKWEHLLQSKKWIVCEGNIDKLPDSLMDVTLEHMLMERFEEKVNEIETMLDHNGNDWESVFFKALAKGFGFHVNSGPFELLVRSFDFNVFRKCTDQMLKLEALMFGQAGLLDMSIKDEYNQQLIKEYHYLQYKYQLIPMKGKLWKFMRMRPVNFPTIRIAQLASLYFQKEHLFGKLIDCTTLQELRSLFSVKASSYWDQHYSFGKRSSVSFAKSLGSNAFDLLLINTIVPLLYIYGERYMHSELSERALLFLHQTRAEKNALIKQWGRVGIVAKHAGHSQALFHMRKNYCVHTRCLECRIGKYLIEH